MKVAICWSHLRQDFQSVHMKSSSMRPYLTGKGMQSSSFLAPNQEFQVYSKLGGCLRMGHPSIRAWYPFQAPFKIMRQTA